MTLPASGTISLSQFSTEMGQASNFSASLSWIKANTKAGQESNSVSGYYGKAWYQKNNGGAADTRAWLQNNCNCDCNCACDCNCNCSCFLAGSLVLMEDGELRPIELVRIGEKVLGGGGFINTVIAYDRPRLGSRPMYRINCEHETTNEHAHFGPDGIFAIDASSFAQDRSVRHAATLTDGRREYRHLPFLDPAKVSDIKVGTVLTTPTGSRAIETIEQVRRPGDTPLFNLIVDGSHTYFVNGYLVSGWAGEDDFDYSTWSRKC